MKSDGFELEDKSIIANNLRLIREHWGDNNRREFVELLGGIYPYETIRSYEDGKNTRSIPEDYINAISELYGVSVQMIKEQTLTEELLIAFDKPFSVDEFKDGHDFLLFTASSSDAAMENEDFKEADRIYQSILDLKYTFESLSVARNLYYKSFTEKGLLPGAANTLLMLCIEYNHISIDNSQEMMIKLLRGTLTNGQFYSKYRKMWSNLTPERKIFIEETSDIFDKCVSALAETFEGRIYAEYYMALKYLICMVDNGRDYRENLELGLVMMRELSKLNNRFASKVVKMLSLDE